MKAAPLVFLLLLGPPVASSGLEIPVEQRPFSVEVEAEALVVPGQPQAVALGLGPWSTWVLKEVAPHGSRLKKGSLILRGEPLGFEVALRNQRLEVSRRKVALAEATEQLHRLKASAAENEEGPELELARARVELAREEDAEARQRLEELEAARAAMTVSAPANGVLYHGEFRGAEWRGDELTAGIEVPAGRTVAMLIPEDDRPHLVAAITQEQVPGLETEMKGTAELEVRPGSRLPVEVAWMSPVPEPGGRFLLRLSFMGEPAPWPHPGMVATLRLRTYHAPAAVTLPREALHLDAEGQPRVAVRLADGTSELRPVTLGRQGKREVEVLDGLEPGQVVVQP